MKKYQLSPILKKIASVFKSTGYACFLVGGAVRNIVLNKKPVDYDLATDAHPDEVMKIFRKVIPTGIQHGTVTVLFKGTPFEVTTFRIEGDYSDSRHPDSIRFTPSIFDDLKRRDFTINAMAIDMQSGDFYDPHGGYPDLKKKIIRAIGDPLERFEEDGLRPLRAVRFASQLEFAIEDNTYTSIKKTLLKLESVSIERVRNEIEKILESNHPSIGLEHMHDTGILSLFIPELSECEGIPQKGRENFDLLMHSIFSCEGAPSDRLDLRLAALLHDIGKAKTMKTCPDDTINFHGHDLISAETADSILQRLKFPNNVRKKVLHLIRHHMFSYDSKWSDAAVRRFIHRVGIDNVRDLFTLRRADIYGTTRERHNIPNLEAFRKHIEHVLNEDSALNIRDLVVDGNVLHSKAGIPKNHHMGTILDFLLESVLEDPALNTEDKLIELAKNFYNRRINIDNG